MEAFNNSQHYKVREFYENGNIVFSLLHGNGKL